MNESLRKGYEEIHSKYEKQNKPPKLRKDLDDVTLNNPRLLLAEGFRQLEESKQPAETKNTNQLDKTEDTKELNAYLSVVDATIAKMDDIMQVMNKTK